MLRSFSQECQKGIDLTIAAAVDLEALYITHSLVTMVRSECLEWQNCWGDTELVQVKHAWKKLHGAMQHMMLQLGGWVIWHPGIIFDNGALYQGIKVSC